MTRIPDEPFIITPSQIDDVEPNLPPPGHERDEELKARTDNLEAAAESIQTEHEVYGVDPSSLEPDREILQHMDELTVDKAQPGYHYKWEYFGQNGRNIWRSKRLGWAVVDASMPEAPELKGADGYRRIGDTLLMRITDERFAQIEAQQEYKRLAQQEGINSRILELGEKVRGSGIRVVTDPEHAPTSKGNDNMMEVMKKRHARAVASQKRDQMLRTGAVPGLGRRGTR